MMQLSRICLVQWHLFVKADLDVQGDAAILGPNRSGKSTLIDLIQTVMTGGAANLYKFNRSAGDGGGRSERTLRAYCLGQLDEHATLRTDAITHIALVFQDEDGVRPPVTVGLCVEASVRDEARIEGRYVAVGLKADTGLFLEDHEGGGQRSAAWPVVRDRLERACANAGGRLLRNDTARAHIKEYMRQLFTDRRAPDPDLFARTFVMALSFSDIPSVEEFVRRHLLEKNDIDIGELRESIQRYRQIQKDIHELERRLEALRALQGQIGRFADLLKKEQVARGVERTAALIEAASALLSNLAKRRAKQRELAETSGEIDRYQAQIDQTEETIRSLEAQINASDIASQRAVLTSDQRRLEANWRRQPDGRSRRRKSGPSKRPWRPWRRWRLHNAQSRRCARCWASATRGASARAWSGGVGQGHSAGCSTTRPTRCRSTPASSAST
jgi:predicted ATP-dependent endonuclease of OLD family